MQLVLRAAGIIGIIVSVIWWIVEPSFDPLYAFITGLVALLSSFIIPTQDSQAETLDERNRHVMLNHVENFWVKGILEKSLHGVALFELGIKEDPRAINYPWVIRRESTNETLPAGKSMLEIFEEIGAGRSLLILGAPGSGKTTMLLELARLLIERARNNETEPIPVVFNLASWNEKQTFADWLADQLNILYYVPRKTAPKWVIENKMLLLLDGLDEVKQDNRAKCVEIINQFRNEHGLTSLVVCSRIEEYQAVNTKLSLEGAITLQPLTSKQVNAYFEKFGKSLASVKQLLKKDKTLRELAATPLMLSIMVLAYKDKKPGELPTSNNKKDQHKHLFNAYINRMFERPTRVTSSSFTKQQTLHYLNWLAQKMIQHNFIAYQIEAMQPSWLEDNNQRRLYKWSVMLIFGLIFGLIVGLSLGLLGGLWGGLSDRIQMVDKLSWSWYKFRRVLIVGLIVGLSLGLIVGLIFGIFGLSDGLSVGLIGGLSVVLSVVLSGGLSGVQIEETYYPGQRIKQTLYNSILNGLIGGLIGGLIFGLSLGLGVGLFGLIIGLSLGLIGGLWGGLDALFQHYTLHYMLIMAGYLPRRLIPFLEHSVDLIFLRRVGGSYIFTHRLLMEHFAEMDVEKL